MKKTSIILLILIVLISLFSIYKISEIKKNKINKKADADSSMNSNIENNSASSSLATSTNVTAKTFTLSEVESHASKDSCWSAIEGKVYDLTSWIGKHPGGSDKILSICGKDGTELFDGKHGMDSKPKSLLPKFYLGDFVSQ